MSHNVNKFLEFPVNRKIWDIFPFVFSRSAWEKISTQKFHAFQNLLSLCDALADLLRLLRIHTDLNINYIGALFVCRRFQVMANFFFSPPLHIGIGSYNASPFIKDVYSGVWCERESNSLEAAALSSRHLLYFSLVIPPFFHQHTLIILWFSYFLCPCCAPHRVAFFHCSFMNISCRKLNAFFLQTRSNVMWTRSEPLSDLLEWSNKS